MIVQDRTIDIGVGRPLKINLDEEALLTLLGECFDAIKKAHPDFEFSKDGDYTHYVTRIIIRTTNTLTPKSKETLTIHIWWKDIDYICKFEGIELEGGIFPNCLSQREKLELQKYIIKEIGKIYKGVE